MLFAKITNLYSVNFSLIRYRNNSISQDLFLFHDSLNLFGVMDTSFCYLVCVEYNYMIIIYAYLVVSIILNQHISIDYIKSINSIMTIKFVNPGLLILSICLLFYSKSISVLVLEVSACNLTAFSLYYWLGFQFIRKREYYYNTSYLYNISNTAYILLNIKNPSKNIFRRYCL